MASGVKLLIVWLAVGSVDGEGDGLSNPTAFPGLPDNGQDAPLVNVQPAALLSKPPLTTRLPWALADCEKHDNTTAVRTIAVFIVI